MLRLTGQLAVQERGSKLASPGNPADREMEGRGSGDVAGRPRPALSQTLTVEVIVSAVQHRHPSILRLVEMLTALALSLHQAAVSRRSVQNCSPYTQGSLFRPDGLAYPAI